MMEGPRGARPEELPLVEELANTVFRGEREDALKTMFQEYPDLYHVSNAENVRIILENGKPVSNVNFLPQTLSIFGSRIKAATLGGVCTLKEYRGRGYGTMLLNDCIEQMKKKGISVLHISGDRFMYRNAGSLPAGKVNIYTIAPGDAEKLYYDGLVTEEFTADCTERLKAAAKLYRTENVRYIRSFDRFRQLIASTKFVDRPTKSKKSLLIREGSRYAAYITLIIRQNDEGGTEASIVDWAGSRKAILGAAKLIVEKYRLNALTGYFLEYEEEVRDICLEKSIPLKTRRFPGTIKIIDFKGFMEALCPYFAEIYEPDFVDRLEFSVEDGQACIRFGNASVVVPDLQQLNDLVFGCDENTDKAENALIRNGDATELLKFMGEVFPIPFVYTANLNCV